MKSLDVTRYALISGVAAALLAGCGESQTPIGGLGAMPQSPVIAPGARLSAAQNKATEWRTLYVVNSGGEGGSVTVYGPGSASPLRTITTGMRFPEGLAFDSSGNLYVANRGSVTVYDSATGSLIRTLDVGDTNYAIRLVFDQLGYLYVDVAGGGSRDPRGFIAIFSPNSSKRFATIKDRINVPKDIIINAGDVFVANDYDFDNAHGWISVYKARTTKPLRIITDGFSDYEIPSRLAFDRSGNLYSANIRTMTVYPRGGTKVSQRITRGVNYPMQLAFNKSGDLYVANCLNGCSRSYYDRPSVAVFAPGQARPMYEITRGISGPWDLTLDDKGNLYVANFNVNTVTAYRPGHKEPSETIRNGILLPAAVAIGPQI